MKNKTLNLKRNKANKCINNLLDSIENKYGIHADLDDGLPYGFGYIDDMLFGDFHINISSHMKINGLLMKKVDDLSFIDTIRAIYHEEQHLKQSCRYYYDSQPCEDTIIMATRKLAIANNNKYYIGLNRYNNDLSEIEAESTAINNTYIYIQEQFPNTDADSLICNLINDKSTNSDYFIKGHYKSFDEILDAFSEHYEEAKESEVSGYFAYALRMTDDIDETKDECIRYLQACVRENPDKMELMTKFNSASKQSERDLMIASITCHLHPEINYERVYPCLRCVDLSPENIFGRALPEPPEGLIKEIPREKIERRIEIADSIYKRIIANEYREYLSEMKIDVDLNKSLDVKYNNDKNKTYEP